MGETFLLIVLIVSGIGLLLMGLWLSEQIKAKKKGGIIVGVCGFILLLILTVNEFQWKENLSNCFLHFSNQYIFCASKDVKLELIEAYFPESYDEAEKESVLEDFDRYLITEPIPVAQVTEWNQCVTFVVRRDAQGGFITEPNLNLSYQVAFNPFAKHPYKIVEYRFS